jgi:hypothetical protein
VGSVSYQRIELDNAARFSHRIVVGRVLEKSSFRFPGSPQHPAQSEGRGLQFFRVRAERILKGSEIRPGGELRVFSSIEWFQHTHAAVIEGGVLSYADCHYSGGIPAEEIETGMEIVFFLNDTSAPSGFPTGSVFLAFGEAHDRVDREGELVAVIRDGPRVEFDHPISMKIGDRIRFPDHLEIRVTGHSHKRPKIDGPSKEWIDLELSKDGRRECLALAHHTAPDGSEEWESRTWGPYRVEVNAMSGAGATLVVRRTDPPPESF